MKYAVLQQNVFQWISWSDISQQLTEDYVEWVSEEGANGRMVYRTVDGVTYILPEYWEGAMLDQIGCSYTSDAYRIMYVLKEVNGGSGWSLCDHLRGGGRDNENNTIDK